MPSFRLKLGSRRSKSFRKRWKILKNRNVWPPRNLLILQKLLPQKLHHWMKLRGNFVECRVRLVVMVDRCDLIYLKTSSFLTILCCKCACCLSTLVSLSLKLILKVSTGIRIHRIWLHHLVVQICHQTVHSFIQFFKLSLKKCRICLDCMRRCDSTFHTLSFLIH